MSTQENITVKHEQRGPSVLVRRYLFVSKEDLEIYAQGKSLWIDIT